MLPKDKRASPSSLPLPSVSAILNFSCGVGGPWNSMGTIPGGTRKVNITGKPPFLFLKDPHRPSPRFGPK